MTNSINILTKSLLIVILLLSIGTQNGFGDSIELKDSKSLQSNSSIHSNINNYFHLAEQLEVENDYFEAYKKLIQAAYLAYENNLIEYSSEIFIKALNLRLKYSDSFPEEYPKKNDPFLKLCRIMQQSLSSDADFWHKQAIEECQRDNDTSCILDAYTSFSLLHTNRSLNKEAIEITEKALKIAEAYDDTAKYARILLDYSDLLNKLGQHDKALEICNKGYKIIQEYEHQHLTIEDFKWSFFFIELKAFIKHNQNNLQEAKKYYLACLDSIQNVQAKGGASHSDIRYITCVRLGKLYFDIGEIEKADSLFIIAEDIKNQPENQHFNSILLYESMVDTYEKSRNYKKAFWASEKYRKYIYDSYLAAEKQHNQSRRDLATLNIQNAQKEIALLKQKTEKTNQRNKILWLTVGILSMGIFAVILYFLNRQKQKNNISLLQKNRLIVEQKREITSSIEYAEKIQNAILPSRDLMQKHFPESFVFYLPRDIVSGDFYWIHPTEDKVFLACADCTGHGVPGAIVSMIGNNGLNSCVNDDKEDFPNLILNRLNDYIDTTFIKSDQHIQDGMDISLIGYKPKTLEIEYSGANIPLYIVRNKKIITLKPNKQPIGKFDHHKPFDLQTFQLEKNDMVYMFSDGLQDQFGGPKNKKFKISNLKKLLIKMSDYPIDKQLETISMSFFDWQEGYEQVDDLCFIAFRA